MDDETRVTEELRQIIAVLTELTSLPSRWSGRVELVPGAAFKGRKPFLCDILLNAALARQEIRWATLIHEALHSFSAGYVRTDFEEFRGWEEGVVEQLQRLLRPTILGRIGVTVDETLFLSVEAAHLYNGYIASLEGLRGMLDVALEPFYLDLLQTPIKERFGSIYTQGNQLPPARRLQFLQLLSRSNAILKDRF